MKKITVAFKLLICVLKDTNYPHAKRKPEIGHFQLKGTWPTKCKKKKNYGYNLNSNRDGKSMKIFAPKPIRGEVTDTQIQDFMDVKMSAKLS